MKYGSILVVTYHRSGSTLLQGVLNRIPGCLVRGENANMCFHLFNAYRAVLHARTRACMPESMGTPQHPWFGNTELDAEYFLDAAGALVKRLLLADAHGRPGVLCYGFKEVRYRQPQVREVFAEYLDFLARIFPRPAFIFNTRNLDDVARSGWLREFEPGPLKADLAELEKLFTAYAAAHANTFAITYEDVIGKTKRLEAMFDFLGAPYDPRRMDEVLAKTHSYKTNREDETDEM